MKKLILKSSFFVVPFFALYLCNILNYNQNEGDLVRVGYLYDNPSPKSLVESRYHLDKKFNLLSEIEWNKKNKFDVVTIGDSFSEQGDLGYKNFLAHKGLSVLHIDRSVSGKNPTQTTIDLLNSSVFDSIEVNYLVLQIVERSINQRSKKLNFERTIALDTLEKRLYGQNKVVARKELEFFSDATFKIPYTNLEYKFQHLPKYSTAYKYDANSDELFTNNPKNLLFYRDEITNLQQKNDSILTKNTVAVLNQINKIAEKKKIKLIVLVSPDKYDLYYSYIKENEKPIAPTFFDVYNGIKKKYLDVNAYQLLSKQIEIDKDIYYYDDTHWSPKGANMIAQKIADVIHEDLSQLNQSISADNY